MNNKEQCGVGLGWILLCVMVLAALVAFWGTLAITGGAVLTQWIAYIAAATTPPEMRLLAGCGLVFLVAVLALFALYTMVVIVESWRSRKIDYD